MSLRLFSWLSKSISFEKRHKSEVKAFTRDRKLPFKTVLQLLLRKSVKPLQLVLNEWTDNLDYEISASALSQARRKLNYTAFIELHQKCVIDVMYRDEDYLRFKGKRLLALDGTTLRLPNTEELIKKFGIIENMNGKKERVTSQVEAKASVLYDVLNEIPISASLFPGRTNEVKASAVHMDYLQADDVLIADRAFISYRLFAEITSKKADFVIRCRGRFYESYHGLFSKETNVKEVVSEVVRPQYFKNNKELPSSMKIRFVRIPLDSGEIEVLATSLLDDKHFPYECFKELYYKRWGIETYFQTLKSRLSIDNFTGKTIEAIFQDFYSTIFVSGLETIITGEANEELSEKNTKYFQKVNKAISFHTIKNKVIKILFDMPRDADQQIKKLFLQNPTNVRLKREKPPRRVSSTNSNRYSLFFQRYARKHVF